jgi:hypothetical protein
VFHYSLNVSGFSRQRSIQDIQYDIGVTDCVQRPRNTKSLDGIVSYPQTSRIDQQNGYAANINSNE